MHKQLCVHSPQAPGETLSNILSAEDNCTGLRLRRRKREEAEEEGGREDEERDGRKRGMR